MSLTHLRIATRQSPLALWQAEHIRIALLKHHPHLHVELLPMTTSGDKLLGSPLAQFGGKGLFVKELEQALLDKRADIAVHSMKDLPVLCPDGLEIAIICERDDPRDAFVSNQYQQLADLPSNAIVGTTSMRRRSQLLALRPDLKVEPLRGNVNTRLAKLDAGQYDAVILAVAGLIRLGFENRIKQYLTIDHFLPAVAQGALGIECRSDDQALKNLISTLDHAPTRACILAERSMNAALGGGCQVPIAAYATISHEQLKLQGLVAKLDGSVIIRAHATGAISQAEKIGQEVAADLIKQGATAILQDIYDAP